MSNFSAPTDFQTEKQKQQRKKTLHIHPITSLYFPFSIFLMIILHIHPITHFHFRLTNIFKFNFELLNFEAQSYWVHALHTSVNRVEREIGREVRQFWNKFWFLGFCFRYPQFHHEPIDHWVSKPNRLLRSSSSGMLCENQAFFEFPFRFVLWYCIGFMFWSTVDVCIHYQFRVSRFKSLSY